MINNALCCPARYDECHGVYREIIRTTSDDYDLERLTNLAAVTVHRVSLLNLSLPH